ncbi:MAG: hypothetical protein ABI983_01275 [Acidobacteriota bacterium]
MAKKAKKKKPTPKKTSSKKASPKKSRKSAAPKRTAKATIFDSLLGPMKGATSREIGGVKLDVASAGGARVKRMIYPPGFRWSKSMKPITGTDRCMHAHVGFIARGEIHIEYGDGCIVEFKAPQVVAIDPGHDGWVVGREPVVMIEFDFEGQTIERLGMPAEHRH